MWEKRDRSGEAVCGGVWYAAVQCSVEERMRRMLECMYVRDSGVGGYVCHIFLWLSRTMHICRWSEQSAFADPNTRIHDSKHRDGLTREAWLLGPLSLPFCTLGVDGVKTDVRYRKMDQMWTTVC